MSKRWQDWVNLVLGVWILISPWALQFAAAGHAWNAYVVGTGIAILAAAALIAFQPWEEWVNLVLGAWLLISPWFLGFSTATVAMWNAVIIGARSSSLPVGPSPGCKARDTQPDDPEDHPRGRAWASAPSGSTACLM